MDEPLLALVDLGLALLGGLRDFLVWEHFHTCAALGIGIGIGMHWGSLGAFFEQRCGVLSHLV